MHTTARRHTLFGLIFAVLGMLLGIYMAASHDHGQHVTHAHVLLLGLVVSLLYGMVYRLWLPDQPSRLAHGQLLLHQVGTAVLVACLYALYGGLLPPATLEPVLAVASFAVLGSALLMLLLFVRATSAAAAAAAERNAVRRPPPASTAR